MSDSIEVKIIGNLSLSDFANKINDEIVKPNCRLCNSKFRQEAEDLAERGANNMTIYRYLDKIDHISYGAIANHITHHFKVKQSETDLREYAGQLSKWSQMSQADDVLINKYVKMLDMEATFLGSKNANVDLIERRKNNEVILKLVNQVTQLKASSRLLNAEMQPIEILFSSLNRIIEMKLKSAISPETRRALQDVIDQLKKEVGEVAIEGNKL